MSKTALIAVDVQNDYLPGGALGFPNSDRIIKPLVEFTKITGCLTIVSRNLHPPDHRSFNLDRDADDPIDKVGDNGGHRPVNCVKGTRGARVISELAPPVAHYVVTKGQSRDQGGYTAFEAGTLRPLESLEDILVREQIKYVTVGGYWLEHCVAQTAFDANALGYDTGIDLKLTI